MTLYLDMDGVLMDFEGAIQAFGVKRYSEGAHWISRPRSEWPPEMVEADRQYVEVMEREDFWRSIRPMADAKLLWDFCRLFAPHILTATPNTTNHRDRIANDKRDSIYTYFDPAFSIDSIHICLRAEKARFARLGAVLVDDTPGNCEEWERAGGTAILHKDAISTIRKLQELGYRDTVRGPTKPALRPRNSKERKGEPIHSGVMLYFPDALAAVARISKAGNDKHNPGETLHWARGKSMDQMDAAARHMLTLPEIDPESGETEAAHNAWRALAQLQLIEEKRLTAAGVMPYSGITT